MKEIKTVDIMSLAKISVMFGVVGGILAALCMFGVGSVVGVFAGEQTDTMIEDLTVFYNIMALGYLIGYPIFSFIGGLVSGALYNLFARWMGGIRWEEKKS